MSLQLSVSPFLPTPGSMGMRHFHYLLGFLTLLGMVHGQGVPVVECTARVWVRAPDLAPNTIVQGDARVKISAECLDVDSITLGLHFKERSFIKALRSREDVKKLQHIGTPDTNVAISFNFTDAASPWPSVVLPSVNQTKRDEYEELLTNKDLWFVREEERAVFETMQPFDIGIGSHGVLRDAVQDFAILVPYTNFPPAFGRQFEEHMVHEIMGVEWIYEYFARIKFSNGTTEEISAGLTSFQPAHDPLANGIQPRSATIELKPHWKPKKTEAIANYTVEISADSGLTFVAGENNHVNAVITRTGFPSTFSAPLSVLAYVIPTLSPKWATEHGLLDERPHHVERLSALRTTSDSEHKASLIHNKANATLPSSTPDEVQAGEIVTTRSETFTIPIQLCDRHVSDFDAYYETLSNSLRIELLVPNPEFGKINPDDSFGEPRSRAAGWGDMLEDDEEPWVPWNRPPRVTMPRMPTFIRYVGNVPVVVHPPGEVPPPQRCLASSTSAQDQVVLSDVNVCDQLPSVTHYLNEGARGPVFVDHSTVDALFTKDPAERNLRAPILKPAVWSPLKGEERVRRYHPISPRPPLYVGETWAKKAVKKSTEALHDGPPMHCVEAPPNYMY